MKQTLRVVLLLVASGTQLYGQASKPVESHREQKDFGAEGDFETEKHDWEQKAAIIARFFEVKAEDLA